MLKAEAPNFSTLGGPAIASPLRRPSPLLARSAATRRSTMLFADPATGLATSARTRTPAHPPILVRGSFARGLPLLPSCARRRSA